MIFNIKSKESREASICTVGFWYLVAVIPNDKLSGVNIDEWKSPVEVNNSFLEDKIKMAQFTLKRFEKLECYENSSIGPMPGLLIELGLETSEQIDDEINGINDPSTYIKSKTKYLDFEIAMLKYMTAEYLNENYSQYKNIDGYVAFCNCAGGVTPISFRDLKIIKNGRSSFQFTVIARDKELYEHYLAGENINPTDYEFKYNIVFEYINERMVISSLDRA